MGTYNPAVYRTQGGTKQVIDPARGGVLQFGEAVDTAAILAGGGTTATKVVSSSASAKNFLGFWVESQATSGDSRGIYLRLYLTGAGGNGEAGRFFTTVAAAMGAGSAAHGIHSTVDITTGGSIAGLAVGLRATLQVGASVTPGGTLAALQVDSNVGAGATLPAPTSLIRLAKAGSVDVTYALDVADDQCLKGDATVNASANNALNVRMPDGSNRWILLYPAA